MKVLVTGGGGFIGRHAVQALAEAGAQVRCLTGPPGSGMPAPVGASGVFEADICDTEALRNYAQGVEVIVHLAGPPSVVQSFEDPCECVRVHVQGTASVLEASRRAGVLRVIYVSSAEIYGCPVSNPVDEDHRVQPRSPYAAAKAAAEKLIEAWHHCYAQHAIVLRPFSVYGPGASPQSLISRIVAQLHSGGDIIVNDLQPVRDYCFVSDFARAVVCACAVPAAYAVFNIGSMKGTSVKMVATTACDVAGSKVRIVEDGSHRRPSDILELVADNRRALKMLGWQPHVPLIDGLRAIIHGEAICAS